MTNQIFIDEVLTELRPLLSKDTELSVRDVTKPNDRVLTGLMFTEKGSAVSPTIYLDDYFENCYEHPATEIAADIAAAYEKSRAYVLPDLSCFSEFSVMQSRVVYRLVNRAKNERFLSNVPHIPYLDFAMIFSCLLCANDAELSQVTITEEHLAMWQIGTAELFSVAKENTPRLLPFTMLDFAERFSFLPIINGISDRDGTDDLRPPVCVLTNELRLSGASVLLYPSILPELAEKFDDDILLLPSSIHELLAMPAKDAPFDMEHLEAIVQEVNASAVDEEDFLSDHIYRYDRAAGRITY